MMRWLRRLDCDRASEMLSGYLDGYLAPQDSIWIEGHLAGCARCRERLAALRGTVSLLQGLPRAEPGRSFLIPPRPVPVPVPVPTWGWRALRLGTAVATVLLVAVITADVLGVVADRSQPALAPRSASPPSAATVAAGGAEGPAGPVGAAAPAAPPATAALTVDGEAPVPAMAQGNPKGAADPAGALGPAGTPAPAPSAEKSRAPMRGAAAEEFQYADTGATAAGVVATPATAPQATPAPAPSPAAQPQDAVEFAREQVQSPPAASNTLLGRTWPLQAGLVTVWLVLVALTAYFWHVRRRLARPG